MKTEHPFKFQIPNGFDVNDLIPNTDMTLESFLENLKNVSFYYEEGEEKYFVQSGTQSFVEALIQFYDLGIENYKPVNSTEHREKVHGIGSINGEDTTVFIVFNGNTFLTNGNSGLTEYLAQSDNIHNVYGSYNIFTDNEAIHEQTVENFLSKHEPNFYGMKEIKAMVDGNADFWEAYKNLFEVGVQFVKPAIELYPSQEKVKNDLLKHNNGRHKVIWPTGTGKFEILMEHSIGHM
jgi:hypothetical protein